MLRSAIFLSLSCLLLACTQADQTATSAEAVAAAAAEDPLAAIPASHEGHEPALNPTTTTVKSGMLALLYRHRSEQQEEAKDTIDVELRCTASQELTEVTLRAQSLRNLRLLSAEQEWQIAQWPAGETKTFSLTLQWDGQGDPADAFCAFLATGRNRFGQQSSKAYAVYLVPRDQTEDVAASDDDSDDQTLVLPGRQQGPSQPAQPVQRRRDMGEADPR